MAKYKHFTRASVTGHQIIDRNEEANICPRSGVTISLIVLEPFCGPFVDETRKGKMNAKVHA